MQQNEFNFDDNEFEHSNRQNYDNNSPLDLLDYNYFNKEDNIDTYSNSDDTASSINMSDKAENQLSISSIGKQKKAAKVN